MPGRSPKRGLTGPILLVINPVAGHWLPKRAAPGQMPSYARPFRFPESGQSRAAGVSRSYEGVCIAAFIRSGIATGAREVGGGDSPFEEMPL